MSQIIHKKKLLSYVASLSVILLAANTCFAKITVNGQGIIETKPNLATFSISIETQDISASKAAASNAQQTEKTVSLLKSIITTENAVTTASYSIYPEYRYNRDNNQSEFVGFKTTNTINVKTNDLANIGSLLDQTTASGITTINNLSFSYDNPEQMYNQALEQAVANAKARANTIAQAGNLEITDIKDIEVISFDTVEPRPMQMYAKAESRMAVETPIEAPNVKSSAIVKIEFETD